MDIPPALIGTGGPIAIVSIVVVLVLTGKLIPRPWHDDRVTDLKEQLTTLQAALASKDEELQVRGSQVDRLLSQSDLTVTLLRSLQQEAGRSGG